MARFPVGAAAAVVWVCCLLAALAVTRSGQPAGVSSGQIAFDSGNSCPFLCNVEVMNGDGSGRHTVAHGYLPVWSPDGSRLAYWGSRNYTARLTVLDLRTGRRRQFSRADPDRTMATPAWSPDGSRLAFIVPRGSKADVNVVTLSDGRVTRVATRVSLGSYDTYHPSVPSPVAWSPDGQSVVYTDPAGELAAVPASGGSGSVLISNAALAAAWGPPACPPGCDVAAISPAFSPDGSMIAFDVYGYGWQRLYVANSDGSNPRQLVLATPPDVNLHGGGGPPRWSGDGSQIAYGEWRKPCGYDAIPCDASGAPCAKGPCPDTAIIRVVVSDGKAEPLTLPQQPDLENPDWSPNDHWLVFNRSGVDGGIWRVRDDGSCLKRLAGGLRPTRGAPADPVWRPGAGSPSDECS